MPIFSSDEFETDFADHITALNIRACTTDQEIEGAIQLLLTECEGEAHFDPDEAEKYLKAKRDTEVDLANRLLEAIFGKEAVQAANNKEFGQTSDPG